MTPIKCTLLVDDDSINNFINERTIRKSGLCEEIQTALNGEEAIKKIKDQGTIPDLILLDLNMPVMDGYQFVKEYSKLGVEKAVIIVMLTTEINQEKEKVLNSFGTTGYISKPITHEKLTKLVDDYFKRN